MATVDFPLRKVGVIITKKLGVDGFYTQERIDDLTASMVKKYGPVQGPIEAQKRIDAYNEVAGIYQVRHRNGRAYSIKEKFYFPGSVNPYTPSAAQLACRAKFAAGVSAWQSLTDEQKAVYNIKGSKKGLPGFNVFLTKYLKS